jgi:hypothetical protein
MRLMRLEISIQGHEPYEKVFHKKEIVIGSSSQCDLVLKADGVSRKHATILQGGGVVYIVDHASTNGTFVNDRKIAPEVKVELSSFFPARLGAYATITLVAEDAPEKVLMEQTSSSPAIKKTSLHQKSMRDPEAEATRFLSKTEINKTLQSPKKQRLPKEDKKRMLNSSFLAFLVVVGGVFGYWLQKRGGLATFSNSQQASLPNEKPAEKFAHNLKKTVITPSASPAIVPDPLILYQQALCATEISKNLCDSAELPHSDLPKSGWVTDQNTPVLLVPALTLDQFKKVFLKDFPWPENLLSDFHKLWGRETTFESRDVAIFYLLRMNQQQLDVFLKDQEFLMIAESNNYGIGKISFASWAELKSELLNANRPQLINELRTNPEAIIGLSGFFRPL